MKIGLFFGSFNPIHVGHLIIANYMAQHSDLEQVWLVVSPHNPLKDKKTLARDRDRLNMIDLAIENNLRLRSSNIEFKMSQPSYTVDTLAYLTEQHPQHEFALIMGGDNLASLHKWKNYEIILERYLIYVYVRPEYPLEHVALATHHNVRLLYDTPQMQISATFIRESIVQKKSIQYLVPDKVLHYIEESRLYR